MKAIKRITALALCALMLLGLLSGCGEKKQGDEKFVLNVSVCNVIDSLDPAMNTDTDADSVFYALYENLMRESDDGSGEVTLTNGMAKEYTEETNYDGSVTYRFTLRSTARWSDGEKVTADDFVYAWQRLADPATDSPNHALMSVVAGSPLCAKVIFPGQRSANLTRRQRSVFARYSFKFAAAWGQNASKLLE